MAFDSTQPVASSLVASAPVRQNFQAIPPSLLGVNWVGDPNFYIWPNETANGAASQTSPPAHYVLSGTGATLQRCGTGLTDTTVKDADDGWAAELTTAAATGYLAQYLLEDDVPVMLQGQSIVFGAWVYTTSSSVARLFVYDSDTGYTYSDYHTGGSSWEWLTVVHEIGNGTTGLQVGLEVATGTNSAYVQGLTAVLGDIAPIGLIPTLSVRGTYGLPSAGPSDTTYFDGVIIPQVPMLFTGMLATATTAPSGDGCDLNARKYDGSSWQDMLASDLVIDDGDVVGSSESPDSTYAYRCLTGWSGATASDYPDNAALRVYCADNTGAAAGVMAHVRGIQFIRPQDALVNWQDPTKFGG